MQLIVKVLGLIPSNACTNTHAHTHKYAYTYFAIIMKKNAEILMLPLKEYYKWEGDLEIHRRGMEGKERK